MAVIERTSHFHASWELKKCREVRPAKLPAPHQNEAFAKLNAWYAGQARAGDGGILVLPTGAGKTFTAVHFLCNGPLSDGYKVLWLAHTHHLLEQAYRCFDASALGHIREPLGKLELRVVSGTPGHHPPRDIRPTDDIVIATLQSITNAHRDRLSQLRAFIKAAGSKLLVVFDEAHHSPAPSYRKLLLDLQQSGAQVLGLTATPTYGDESKKGWLKKLFPRGILAQARVSELIAAEVLARPRFIRTPTSVVPDFNEADYQKWLGTYRDIPEAVIEHLAKNRERNAFIAETYVRNRKEYGKAIIFADHWYQCEAIVEALRKRQVRAGAVYSHVDATLSSVSARRKRDRDENARVLEQFRNNELDVIVNVRMLTEGTDLPDAQTVFLTRQTTSQILLTQMVGRAMRGPKFGGTAEANIVSFIDDWRQAIRWAEYDQLENGRADDDVQVSSKRPPLLLISIDLVKRLSRQLDSGINVAPAPFTSLMPLGWYRVTFDACTPGGDEIESRDHLVMVFEDERKGFEALIAELVKKSAPALAEESVDFEEQRPALEALRAKHFSEVSRSPSDLLFDILQVARHVAQGHGVPEFFDFEARKDHDLDAVAQGYIAGDLGPRAIYDALRIEYERKDRYWRTLFHRFEQFRQQYEACQARLLFEADGVKLGPAPTLGPAPSFAEPDEGVKAQVKRRDGNRCLACGGTRKLQADHVVPAYRGGANDIDHMQTLCATCNRRKGTRTISFMTQRQALSAPPTVLERFDDPEDPTNREHWERFLRRTINFTYRCAAVSEVRVGGRGEGYYNWEVELVDGNPAGWLKPHLRGLFTRINQLRVDAGKPEVERITIVAPGEEAVCYPPKP